jgi:hypothetical protein
MGWTSFPDPMTKAELLVQLRRDMRPHQILQEKVTAEAVYFLVKPADKPSFIAVVLTEKHNGRWSYKDMTEHSHPYFYDCPLSMLDAADPPEGDSAKEWRETVRARAALKAEKLAAAAALEPGQKVRIYGKIYLILRRGNRRAHWIVQGEEDGKLYAVKTADMEIIS